MPRSTACALLVLLFVSRPALAQPPDPYGSHIKHTPPLAAEEQLRKFHLPAGFEIQLVAAEPDVRKPINLAFDAAARLYVTGSVEYPYAAPDPTQGRDVVVRLDLGPDGRATSRQVAVRGLNIPIGVAPQGEDLIVFSIPQVLRCRDLDGDAEFEAKTPLLTGFGQRDTHGLVNGITPWIDGWIYTCHGYSNESTVVGTDGSSITMQSGNTFRWRPDGSRLEYFTHGQVNPFGLAFDPLGNLYSADCHTLPAYLLLRGAYYPSFGKPHDGLGFGPPIMNHQHGSTGIAGIAYYAAEQFPVEYRGTLFIGNPITGCVNHDRLAWHGSSPQALEQPDFLRCDDPWFRPVDLKLGPDGALYIADFYNRIIGHYEVPLEHPQRDRERGRIWRVVYRGTDAPPAVAPNVAQASPAELLELLGHANLSVRTLATNRLALLPPDDPTRTQLAAIVEGDANVWRRVHALWVLERTRPGDITVERLLRLLAEGDAALRVHALGVLANRPDEGFPAPWLEALRRALSDQDALVRRAAGTALAGHRRPENVAGLLAAWQATAPEDTHLQHVLRMAVREHLRVPAAYDRLNDVAAADVRMRGLLAEASLGVPSAESAALVMDYLRAATELGDEPLGRFAEHAVRYSAPDQLGGALASLTAYRDAPPERQASVLRAAQRGLQARGEKLPPLISDWQRALVQELLVDKDEARRRAGLELARDLRRRALFDDVRPLAERHERPSPLRGLAIEACVACDAGRSLELLAPMLADDREEIGLRLKLAQVLGTLDNDDARRLLLEVLKAAPERLAIEIAAALGVTPAGAEALLGAVAAGRASGWLLQEPAVVRGLRRSKLAGLDEHMARLTAGLPRRDDRLQKLIAQRRVAFLAAKHADAGHGREVFKKTCAVCHKVRGEGNKIGPELDGIGLRGLDRLLEDVLDPNRIVDQAFRATQIITSDGRVLVGLALRREGEVQVLADAQGRELRVPVSEIDEQSVSPSSPMPANVAEIVAERDFYDLLAFLLAERQKPGP